MIERRRVGLGLCFGVLGLALYACAAHKAEEPSGDGSELRATEPGALPAQNRTASVVRHHNNGSRDGLYIDPAMRTDTAGALHRDMTFAGVVIGDVYAQPLYVENGPNGAEAFIVATEENHLTAIDGAGNTVWDKLYGAPASGNLPCGNIRPLGVTGTPVIDLGSRTIYFDAMITPDQNATFRHKVFAVSLDDGSIKPGWPLDVESVIPNFRSANHNQRGALELVNGTLYVPYGGHFGDCDPYRGTVLGVPVSAPTQAKAWATPAKRGGIWATGGLASDGSSIYAATGNTGATSTWQAGEAILRFSAGPTYSNQPKDYFAPSNWLEMDNGDVDLGGANPTLVDMPGAPVPHLVVAFGKDANMYIVNRDDFGGIGGALTKTKVASGAILGASAAYHTSRGTYVAFRAAYGHAVGCPVGGVGNIGVVRISPENPPRAEVAWCTDEKGLGSPMVTSTDGATNAILWDASDKLYGYDGDTGAKVFAGGAPTDALPSKMQYFNSPIATKGRMVVATRGRLVVFR